MHMHTTMKEMPKPSLYNLHCMISAVRFLVLFLYIVLDAIKDYERYVIYGDQLLDIVPSIYLFYFLRKGQEARIILV